MRRLKGIFLTPSGFLKGEMDIEGGHVAEMRGSPIDADIVLRCGDPLHVPGFVDLHVHGGGGCDFMDGGESARRIACTHAKYGTTALLATTMTAPRSELEASLRAIAPFIANRPAGGARILGVHLEGPYLNPDKLGAQPDCTVHATRESVQAFHMLAPIRCLTLAPEVQGNMALIPELVAMGIRVQIGHSLATYEDGYHALQCGAHGFTHLFNAMSSLHHRQPGLVGAALAHGIHAEIIPDLLHVHPGAIRAALRAIPNLYCVTDSTAATGMPDGDYRLGRQTVTKCMGGVRLADGTLAGSTLTMAQAVRNLIAIGVPLADAFRRASTIPADFLGILDRGRLHVGAIADIAILDSDLNVTTVIIEGEEIDHPNA